MINQDLAAFVVAQRAEGIPDADISSALIEKGWNANDVRVALSASSAMLAPVAPLPGASVLLSDSLALFRKRFMLLFVIFLPPTLMSIALGFIAPPTLPAEGSGLAPMNPILFFAFLVGSFANVFLYFLANIASILAIMDEAITSPVVAWQRAIPILPRYFLTTIFVGVWVALGFVLLIVPGIIFSVQCTFAVLISVVEGKRASEAMEQSKSYVKGRWGAVATRIFFGILVIMVPSMVIGAITLPLALLGGAPVAKAISALANTMFSGFMSVYLYRLYLSVRRS